MADAPANSYRQLPGSGYRQLVPGWALLLLFFVIGIFVLLLRGRRVRLYLGDDHLLAVEWDGAKEYYKRFRYEDVQALTVRRTNDAMIMNVLMGTLAAVTFLLAVGAADEPALMWVLICFGTIFVVALIMNIVGGTTCQCHLKTAVQVEELVSLKRLKNAERALSLLRERIGGVQGVLPPEEIPVRYQQFLEAINRRLVFDDPNAPPRMI